MGSSRLRPETAPSTNPSVSGGTAYLMVLKAVCWRDGLIHGRFHGPHDTHCAVGSFFDVNPNVSLPVALIDEIAAVNDSVPRYTARARKAHVTRWLKWRLTELGMPGFAPRKRKKVRRG